MQGDPVCKVEQDNNGRMFLASANRKHFFWVEPNDPHWQVISPD